MAKNELASIRFNADGQNLIPQSVIERLNLREGDKLVFVEENGEIMIKKADVKIRDNLKGKRLVESVKPKGDTLRETEAIQEVMRVEQLGDMRFWG